MTRIPESRVKTAALVAGAKAFVDHSITGLKTHTEIVFPSVAARGGRRVISATAAPQTGPRPVTEWDARSGDCLHCGDALRGGAAVPAAKFKTDAAYWVFGQFCGGACALGYCREHAMGPQVALWTREMLRTVFGVVASTTAPPRFMLKRYGGTMDSTDFAATAFCAIKEPPLATFAMFAEAAARPADVHDLVRDGGPLRRPESRDSMPARPTPTGKEPVVLRVLAERAAAAGGAPPSPKRRKGAARKKGASLQLFMEEC